MNEIAANASMKKAGDILRSAREKRGLSYEDVYKFTKIHPRYLRALEEGDYKIFSGGVHIKGFIKIYSKLLNLNEDEILAFFRREFDEKKVKVRDILRPIENPRFLVTPTSVMIFSVLSLVLLFFVYLFYQYRSYSGAPSLHVDSPSRDVTVSENSIKVSGKTDRDSGVFLNGQKVELAPDGSFSLEVDLMDGLNILNFTAVNKIGKETKLSRTVVVQRNLAEGWEKGGYRVILEVLASESPVSLSVQVDGKKVFDGTMLSATGRIFEASESVKIKTNNAGAVSLKLNGVELGPFGKINEAKEQEFK